MPNAKTKTKTKTKTRSTVVDFNADEANDNGCQPCPSCGGRDRLVQTMIICPSCSFEEKPTEFVKERAVRGLK